MRDINDHENTKAKLILLLDYIETDIEAGINSGQSLGNRSIVFKVLGIIVSLFVTVLLGWSFLGDYGKNAAIALSALLTAINTWEAFKTYRERAIHERINVNKLFKLERDIRLCMEGNKELKLEDYESYKKRFDQLHEEYTEARDVIDSKNNGSANTKSDEQS